MGIRRVYLLDPWRPEPAPAGQRVLVPNRHAARRLGMPGLALEALARRRLPAGLTPAPPFVLARALRSVLAERGSPDPVGEAQAVAGALTSLLRSGVDLEALADLRGRVAERASEALALRKRLARSGWIHPAEVLLRAAKSAAEAREPVYVWGYPHLGFDQRIFLDAVAGEESAILLPAPEAEFGSLTRELAGELRAGGWQVEVLPGTPETTGERAAAQFAGRSQEAPGVEVHVYRDLEAEIRGVLAQVKRLLIDGVPGHRIALVTRDDASVGPLALAVAWEYGVRLRALYAIPLAETRLGGWVSLLLEAATLGFPFEATARLLAHPLGPGLSPEAWPRARMTHPSGRKAWHGLGAPDALFTLPHRAPRATMARSLEGLLTHLGVRRKTLFWPRELLAYQALLEGLRTLPDPEEPLELGAFRSEIGELLRTESVPAAPGRGGVELHTPLSLTGAEYDHLFVFGLAEGGFPPPVRDDPALDFFELDRIRRAGYRAESPAESAYREALHFYTLLSGARTRVILSHSHGEGRASAFLGPFPPATRPGTLIASPEEQLRHDLRREKSGAIDQVLAVARAAWRVEFAREGPGEPDCYDGVTGIAVRQEERRFSVTELETLGRCPFRWFATYLLKLAEPEEAPEEVDGALRGRLYHRVLELSVRRGENPRKAGERLVGAFEQAEEELGLTRIPGWGGERIEHLARLRRLVDSGDFAWEDAEVLAAEVSFEGEWRGFRIRGNVDRADKAGGRVVLYDYKTGKRRPKGVKNERGELKLDFQLPVYREAAVPALWPELAPDGAYYLLVGSAKAESARIENGALGALADRLRSLLEAGDFRVQPDGRQEACQFCPYDLVCRKGSRLWRKEGPV